MSPLSTRALGPVDDMMRCLPQLEVCRDSLLAAVNVICACYRAGGKVLLCGNGGSASDADHIVGELMKGFQLSREIPSTDATRLAEACGEIGIDLARRLQRGVAALSLGGQSALLTAVANDTDPTLIYAQQIYVLGRPGDVFVGISTSGASRNVVAAARVARAFGLRVIALTGERGAPLDLLADVLIKAPASETYLIQELHLPLYHAICRAVEQELFGCD
jgi:D-sedoheptulose 7-phosphate isomerase